ncbi:MAG: carboxymuconolactone decarboxylase family protein, partial [Nitrospirales bacterium]
MSFLRTNPNATLVDLFRVHPDFARPLHEFAHRLLRGPSPLSEGERELLAAYVSALNRCEFCRAAHTAVAVRFGMPERLVDQLVQD